MSRVNLRRAGQRDLDVRAQVAIADVLVKLRLAHDGMTASGCSRAPHRSRARARRLASNATSSSLHAAFGYAFIHFMTIETMRQVLAVGSSPFSVAVRR